MIRHEMGRRRGLTAPLVTVCFVLVILFISCFLLWQNRATQPLGEGLKVIAVQEGNVGGPQVATFAITNSTKWLVECSVFTEWKAPNGWWGPTQPGRVFESKDAIRIASGASVTVTISPPATAHIWRAGCLCSRIPTGEQNGSSRIGGMLEDWNLNSVAEAFAPHYESVVIYSSEIEGKAP